MQWSVGKIDRVAAATMAGVVGVAGLLFLTVPGGDQTPQSSTIAPLEGDEGTVHSEPYGEATPSPTDKPAKKEKAKPEKEKPPRPTEPGKVTIQQVPSSGSGVEIVMPGDNYGAVEPTTVDIVVSSFNVLGTSHTRNGARGFAPGATRAQWAAQLIASHDVDIVGLQELQQDQMRVITGALDGEYAIFPGPSMSWREAENSIMWRMDEWYPVQSSTIAIPYFRGATRQMPYLRLRNRDSGADIWVANFHNPATTKKWGDNSRWRAEARRRQIELANKLYSETGLPVIFTGDMNERAEYYCPVVAATALEASTGGSGDGGACQPPAPTLIDWVFGTPEIQWVSSFADRGELVSRTTDHPMIVAKGRLSMVDAEAVEEALEGLERMEDSESE